MYNVLKLNEISPVADEVFGTNFNMTKDCQDPAAIMLRSFKLHDYQFSKETLCVARCGAGVNNIPIDRCAEEGIVVFNTPGANANAVKELVLCAMLLGSRKIISAIDWAKTLKGKGAEVGPLVEKGKNAFVGGEVFGKTLGVIGLGAIGAIVANAAVGLGMNVYGYDPYISIDSAWGLHHGIKHIQDIDTIFKNCDYITVHVPYMDATKGLINAKAVGMMKKGVVIVNCARGELAENQAIIEGVQNGTISRYITDFPNDELLGVENIICIPHLGASTPEAEDNCASAAAKQVIDFIENGNIVNSVNFPACSMPREEGITRITVIHRNVKSVLNKITAVISGRSLNISHLMNKSRNDFSYSIFDVDGEVGNDIVDEIKSSSEDILRVRVIK